MGLILALFNVGNSACNLLNWLQPNFDGNRIRDGPDDVAMDEENVDPPPPALLAPTQQREGLDSQDSYDSSVPAETPTQLSRGDSSTPDSPSYSTESDSSAEKRKELPSKSPVSPK